MERNKTKGKENELTAELTTKVEKNKKEDEMTTATKTKQTKATQAKKPTEEKFLSAKDLAQMAGVKPAVLRRTLRQNFSGKIPRDKDGRQYQIKATDPIVKEIIAKAKASNGNEATTAPANKDKGEGEKPSPESLKGKEVK